MTPSWQQRVVFGATVALLVATAIELLCYGAIAILLRRAPGLAAIHAQQSALVGARLTGHWTRQVRFRTPYRREVVHPYLGFLYPESGDVEVRFALADESRLPRRAPDRLLVGITGGSVAAGFAQEAEKVLVPRLAAATAGSRRKIEVVSLAVPGWKQPQQLMVLLYFLAAGGELDVLINLDGFNEVALHRGENQTEGVFPAFPRSWAIRVRPVPDPEVLPILGRHGELDRKRHDWARELARPPLRWSATAGFVWLVGDRMLGARLLEAQRELLALPSAVTDYAWTGPRISFASEDALIDELVGIWSRASTQLARLCGENDIRYLHLLQPNQYVPDSKPMSAEERRIAINPAGWALPGATRGYPVLVRECGRLAEAGVPCHDLTRLFAQVREPLYIDDCCHFDERGFALLGAYAADALSRRSASERAPRAASRGERE